MSGVFWVFLILLGFASLPGAQAQQETQTQQKAFVGCVNRIPNGTLQLGAVPSGEVFQLQDPTKMAEEHVNQLVRVFGVAAQSGKDNNAPRALKVDRIQALAESCTSGLPAKNMEGVPGKVGEDAVAVPLTTTAAQDQTTAGFQTEGTKAQSSGSHSAPPIQIAEPTDAPQHAEQVAESEAAANANARAAERTEIVPGNTLGVSNSAGTSATEASGTQPIANSPAKPTSQPVVVKITGNEAPKLSPAKVRIKIGQTIEWLNSSDAMQEIIANPARAEKASDATLPAGAKPFDSGLLRANHTFQYHFSVPGTYRYLCKLNNAEQAMGEVVVAP